MVLLLVLLIIVQLTTLHSTGGGNTTGKVSAAGIASLLEGDDQADTNSATYKITASEFPSGKTLTVTPPLQI